jgi:hypothetical protein
VGEIGDEAGPERIQVEIADELPEIIVRLHHDGLIAVLEEVPLPSVPPVVRQGVAGEQAAHEQGEAARPTPEEQVGVVREEGPRVEGGPGGHGDRAEPIEEPRSILLIGHDLPARQPPEHDVVQRAGRIESRLSGHRCDPPARRAKGP